MGRAVKIAAVAALGGLLMTLVILHVSSPPAPGASASTVPAADAPPAAAGVSQRCRSATLADAECEAAWEARRRHFFGQKD